MTLRLLSISGVLAASTATLGSTAADVSRTVPDADCASAVTDTARQIPATRIDQYHRRPGTVFIVDSSRMLAPRIIAGTWPRPASVRAAKTTPIRAVDSIRLVGPIEASLHGRGRLGLVTGRSI